MNEHSPRLPKIETPGYMPDSLQKAISLQESGEAAATPQGPTPLTDVEYTEIRSRILDNIEADCSENPYHNRTHTEEVEQRFLKFAAYANLLPAEVQLGGLRALLHDYGHAGRTIRQEAPEQVIRKDISNEEFAGVMADELLASHLEKDEITYVQVGILGTSFGQTQGPHARPYKPLSAPDKLLAFADIAGFSKGFDSWMSESMNVLRETNPANLPADFETLIKGRNGFLQYIETKLGEIKSVIGQENVDILQGKLNKVKAGLNSEAVKKYRQDFDKIRSEIAVQK